MSNLKLDHKEHVERIREALRVHERLVKAGRKGGKKSRRRLTKKQARLMNLASQKAKKRKMKGK